MKDGSFLISISDKFVKTVHVELSDEGEKIIVFEVLREYLCGEPSDIFDSKGIAIWRPVNDLLVLRVLSKVKHTSTILKVLAKKMGILFRMSYFSLF